MTTEKFVLLTTLVIAGLLANSCATSSSGNLIEGIPYEPVFMTIGNTLYACDEYRAHTILIQEARRCGQIDE